MRWFTMFVPMPSLCIFVLYFPLCAAFFRQYSFCEDSKVPRSTFLWSVRQRTKSGRLKGATSYLFGTIHVPYSEVWDWIDPSVHQAFAKSDEAVFELDLSDHNTVDELRRCQKLPSGHSLHASLPRWLFTALERYMSRVRRALPVWLQNGDSDGYSRAKAEHIFKRVAGDWERKRAIWVMLAIQSLTPNGVRQTGVPVLDLYLAQLARIERKPTMSIEKVHEQCRPLNKLRRRQVIFALNHTLHSHERRWSEPFGESATEKLIRHYNCGQLDSSVFQKDVLMFESSNVERATRLNNYFHKKLIRRRNKRMSKRARRLIRRHPRRSFFFAFGAGHFLGPESIAVLLKDRRFDVRPVAPSQHRTSFGLLSPYRFYQRPRYGALDTGFKLSASAASQRSSYRSSSRYPKTTNELWIRLDDYKRKRKSRRATSTTPNTTVPMEAFYRRSNSAVYSGPLTFLTLLFFLLTL